MKKIILEFKKFAMRGNVIDMAVGIIIGAAFGKIVDSLVKDILMPPLGILLGKIDFTNMFIVLKNGTGVLPPYPSLEVAKNAGAVTLNIGMFLNNVISFIIVAFAVFLLIKAVNKLQEKMDKDDAAQEVKTPTVKNCPYCCSSIPVGATRCPNCTSELADKKK